MPALAPRRSRDVSLSVSGRYFKVEGSDGGIYILRYDLELNRWELTMYDSGGHDDTRLSST
jgi:hypothetical protein